MSSTLEEVAKAAGVSITTASRVLTQNTHPVRAATRQRVLRAAAQLQYKPNLLARSMRTDRTHTIGIIADDLLSPFTPPIIRGIQDYLKEIDYLGLIVNADWDPEIEREAIDTLLSRAVEGIIFVESGRLAPTQELVRSQKPYMFVHRLFGAPVQNSVVPDDYGGARLVLEHLLALGHRRIGHIAGPLGWHSAQRRTDSYLDTLSQHGLAIDPALIVESDWEFEGGAAAMQQLLKVSPLPTALFAANDMMALGAIETLRHAGLRVPEDMALAGYDNRDFSRFLAPQLTTVSLPTYQMGAKAAELLWQKIQGAIDNLEEVQICGQLHIRASCGAPAWQRTHDAPDLATTVRHRLTGKQPEKR
ncbi:MAG: LacI family DNA-binding transcriptional regulator [Caldilineaceae bacterium]